MLILFALLAAPAQAQDAAGVDAHGFLLAPSDSDLKDPVVAFRPETQVPMSFGFAGVFEYADSPLVQFERVPNGDLVRTPLLDDLFALNLSAHGAFHERVAVGLTVPVVFTSVGPSGAQGPTLGDIRLTVPVGLVLPDPESGGFGLSVVPFADLPTGNTTRFLGNAGFSGGALVAAGYDAGDFAITANLGAGAQAPADFLNLQGGLYVLGGVNAAYQLGDHHALGLETWVRPRAARNAYGGSESPGELMAYGRGQYDFGLNWLAGASLGITSGAGASNFRLFAGVGWRFGKEVEKDRDGDGILDKDDACPDVPEVVNGWADQDGCADDLASITITVVDEDGGELADAFVTIDGKEYRTDPDGKVTLTERMPGTTLAASGEHPWCLPGSIDVPALKEGHNKTQLKLAFRPSQVKVITKANTGQVLDATVRFRGPTRKADANVGPDGEEIFELRPGDWEILVSAPDFGVESRELSLAPGETSLIVIEVILHPAKVKVETTKVVILEKVYFDLDKDTIKAESLPLLREVANTIKANPSLLRIEIGGHTDIQGDAPYNLDLSQRRVDSVMRYLVERGVEASRLVAKGYGETMTIKKGNSEAAHAANRRVEFSILEKSEDAPEVQQGGGR